MVSPLDILILLSFTSLHNTSPAYLLSKYGDDVLIALFSFLRQMYAINQIRSKFILISCTFLSKFDSNLTKMKTKILLVILASISIFSFKSDKMAYQLFDINGKVANYEQLLKSAKEADIVLFGELHDNPIGHWLQLELTKDLFEAKKSN